MAEQKVPTSVRERRRLVDVADPTLSVRRQGNLLEISRSSTYYQAIPVMSAERIRQDQHYFSRFVV
ncbi:MAG: hypothetical protein OXC27_00440 [Caldilineaceae bacterium]|nr:hypothetical protein [Caldilineaceae bacterium]